MESVTQIPIQVLKEEIEMKIMDIISAKGTVLTLVWAKLTEKTKQNKNPF